MQRLHSKFKLAAQEQNLKQLQKIMFNDHSPYTKINLHSVTNTSSTKK